MAVNALELRPRNAIALFDAAVRVCATTSGVWVITLPASALLVAALFNLGEAIQRHRALAFPVLWWTLAWALRAIAQGAACAHLEEQILSDEPSAWQSWRAALARAPGLITASLVMLLLNSAILVFTAGVGFLFFGAHAAGYASIMRGQGSALNVYGNASKLLGAARHSAPWVRLCGVTQFFVGANLFLAVTAALYLARALFGFEVSFLLRFTSPENPLWLATVAVATFALFEPVRAATGTLLLIDGRVRQEGLDLLSAAQQLPRRKRRAPSLGAAGLLALLSFPAFGEELADRLREVAEACSMEQLDAELLERTRSFPARDQVALARFVARIEHTVWDEEDCEAAEATLRQGLTLMDPSTGPSEPTGDPAALAQATLARPEFAVAPPVAEAPPEEPQSSDWSRWWARFWRWLREQLEAERDRPHPTSNPNPMAGANLVMILAGAAVAAVLAYLLLRGLKRTPAPSTTLDESGAMGEVALEDPASALTKPAERWAGLADELARQGSFREAIRHLYLALLARLHRDGAIDYEPTRSNWDYLTTFKGPTATRSAFRQLTLRFDFAWYGNLDVTPSAWASFRRLAEPLLSPTPIETASRG